MRSKFLKFVSVSLLLVAAKVNAGIITNADIADISIDAPANWTWFNVDALFNGITKNGIDDSERFVGWRGVGASSLSVANPFVIDVLLSTEMDISGISIFHDWGNRLDQQVSNLSISLFSSSGKIGVYDFSGLRQNTFDEIPLLNGVTFSDVNRIEFAISSIAGVHFEIREFVLQSSNLQSSTLVPVSVLGLSLLSMLIIFGRRL